MPPCGDTYPFGASHWGMLWGSAMSRCASFFFFSCIAKRAWSIVGQLHETWNELWLQKIARCASFSYWPVNSDPSQALWHPSMLHAGIDDRGLAAMWYSLVLEVQVSLSGLQAGLQSYVSDHLWMDRSRWWLRFNKFYSKSMEVWFWSHWYSGQSVWPEPILDAKVVLDRCPRSATWPAWEPYCCSSLSQTKRINCENHVRELRTFFTVVLEPNIHTFSVLSETLPDFLKSKLCWTQQTLF